MKYFQLFLYSSPRNYHYMKTKLLFFLRQWQFPIIIIFSWFTKTLILFVCFCSTKIMHELKHWMPTLSITAQHFWVSFIWHSLKIAVIHTWFSTRDPFRAPAYVPELQLLEQNLLKIHLQTLLDLEENMNTGKYCLHQQGKGNVMFNISPITSG